MMKALLVLALASAPVAAPVPQWANGEMNSDWPPIKYDKDAIAVTAYVNDVEKICGTAPPPYKILACASAEKAIMVLPNPCAPEFRGEFYAKIVCHERAHINLWPGDHPA